MKHQLCVVPLRMRKFTLKRFVSLRAIQDGDMQLHAHYLIPEYSNSYKSIPGMPTFDTVEQAQAYRNLVGWFIDI